MANDHYVSQLYLKRFKTPKSRVGKEQIHMYMKEENRYVGNPSVAKVASENRFYDVPGDNPRVVDNNLEGLETHAGPILNKLVAAETADVLTHSDMNNLAYFLAAQHYRTRKFRNMQTESVKSLVNAAENHPEHFEEFIKENSQYTVPDVERMLSERRIELASYRLEVLQLPTHERVQRMTILDEELRQFNDRSEEVVRLLDGFKRGKVPDELLQVAKMLSENPEIKQAQSLQTSIPKFAQRLLSLEWLVHKYSQDANLLTSDNPLIFVPLAEPASKDDLKACELFSMTCLGVIHFYLDEVIEDYPPTAFMLPLTPHLRLVIAPPGDMQINGAILDSEDAAKWNLFQVAQAHRFIFSAQNDFSVVPKAVEWYRNHKQFLEETVPGILAMEPHLHVLEPRHKRWKRY